MERGSAKRFSTRITTFPVSFFNCLASEKVLLFCQSTFKRGLICANEFVCNRLNDCKVVRDYELPMCALGRPVLLTSAVRSVEHAVSKRFPVC